MKKTLILMLSLWYNSNFAQVKISFQNNTGEKLEDITVGMLNIGSIDIDSTQVVEFPVVSFGSTPLLHFSGLYISKKLRLTPQVICGNGIKVIKEGTFKYGITIKRDEKGEEHLVLSRIRSIR